MSSRAGRALAGGTAPHALTRATLLEGVDALRHRDRRLAGIVERFGPPPLFARPRGFATLAWIILEQQVSLASAAAVYARLAGMLGGNVTPEGVLALGPQRLAAIGFTRQKARYVTGLAARLGSGELDLQRVARLRDDEAGLELLAVPGIGPWTAGVYLLMALRRPDVWPPGDLGLHKSMSEIGCMRKLPSSTAAAAHALRWRPWRAVAARLLWHSYLSLRRKPAWGMP